MLHWTMVRMRANARHIHSDTFEPRNRIKWELREQWADKLPKKLLSFSKMHKGTHTKILSRIAFYIWFVPLFSSLSFDSTPFQQTITSKSIYIILFFFSVAVVLMCLSISLNNSLSFQREHDTTQRMRKIKRWNEKSTEKNQINGREYHSSWLG